jgi:hypothetical protein
LKEGKYICIYVCINIQDTLKEYLRDVLTKAKVESTERIKIDITKGDS